MINKIKFIVLIIVLYIALKVIDVKNWFSRFPTRKFILCIAIWFRVFLVLDFIVSCYAIVIKYNPTNIDVQCVYIGFLVFVFLLMTLYIKKLKKGE